MRITEKQAVHFRLLLLFFEFITRLPPLTNPISIICAPLIVDLFVLHDIIFFLFSLLSFLYMHIYIFFQSFIQSYSVFLFSLSPSSNTSTYSIFISSSVNPKKDWPEEQKKTDVTPISNHMMSCVCVLPLFSWGKETKFNVGTLVFFSSYTRWMIYLAKMSKWMKTFMTSVLFSKNVCRWFSHKRMNDQLSTIFFFMCVCASFAL